MQQGPHATSTTSAAAVLAIRTAWVITVSKIAQDCHMPSDCYCSGCGTGGGIFEVWGRPPELPI